MFSFDGSDAGWSSTVALTSALIVTVVTLAGWMNQTIGSLLPVSGVAVFERGEVWRAWTACFAHADAGHLLSNLFFFVIFGRLLGAYFGYWLFPFWAFVLGGLANLAVLSSYAPEVKVLGASGVVNVLGGMWLSLFFLISRQYKMNGRILRTLGVALLLFAPQEFRPEVAERVHAAGLFSGILFGIVWFFLFKRRIRNYEVWEPIPPDDPEDELPPPDFTQQIVRAQVTEEKHHGENNSDRDPRS
ncbi:MAG: rhomboid family intramembrane serine protease [Bdellovibrionales bacterium]|nr:rhomboid family intramembrane serine protease [Bdellovibrionales bacterium]